MIPTLFLALISTPSFYYGNFVEGSSAAVFLPEIALHAEASMDSDTLGLIARGGEVVVSEGGSGPVDGMYAVDYNGMSGYVLASGLAVACLHTQDDGLFLFGVSGTDDNDGPSGEAMIIDRNGSSHSCPVSVRPYFEGSRFNYCVEALELPSEGLEGVETAVMLKFIYEACGYTNRDYLLVWNGDDLVPGPDAASVSEASLFSHQSSLGLPADHGETDVIVVTTRHREWVEDEAGISLSVDEESFVRFSWNGRSFELEP